MARNIIRDIFTSNLLRRITRKVEKSKHWRQNPPIQSLERKIWIYWAQGLEEAPEIVQYCINSWKQHNPTWDIVFLNDRTVGNFINASDLNKRINRTAYSDILRCRLLRQYGGVWVDATVLCTKPLDDWLNALMYSGFFVYSWPTSDRPISSWFMASVKGGKTITRLTIEVDDYWRNNRWKPSTYFWLHSIFLYLIVIDADFKKSWRMMPKVSAVFPLMLQRFLLGHIHDDYIDSILSSPVHKLTWKKELTVFQLEKTLARACCGFSDS